MDVKSSGKSKIFNPNPPCQLFPWEETGEPGENPQMFDTGLEPMTSVVLKHRSLQHCYNNTVIIAEQCCSLLFQQCCSAFVKQQRLLTLKVLLRSNVSRSVRACASRHNVVECPKSLSNVENNRITFRTNKTANTIRRIVDDNFRC